MISKWFKDKELSLAIALNLSFARLSSILSGLLIPFLYSKYSLWTSLMSGFYVSLISACAGIFIVFIQSK